LFRQKKLAAHFIENMLAAVYYSSSFPSVPSRSQC